MNRNKSFPYPLYLIISEESCQGKDLFQVAEEAIAGGVDVVQLREKTDPDELFLEKASRLKKITDRYNVPLIINDNLEVAMASGAFGIHVGNNDLPPSVIRKQWKSCQHIGYSIEYLEQLDTEEVLYADALAVSPVFTTPTKKDTVTEWGINGIATMRSRSSKPLIAIGNIQHENLPMVLEAGADCAAVVSAICAAPDPRAAAYRFKQIINNYVCTL